MAGIDAYSQAVLHMEGLDNGTTFTDSSPLPNTVISYGVKTKTAVKAFGDSSAYFDGASYLALDDINNWVLRSTWTVDFRARFDAAGGNQTLYSVCTGGGATDRYNLRHYVDTGVNYLEFYAVSAGVVLMLFKAPWSPTPGQFYHIEVCRTLTDLTIYVDGAALTPLPSYTCSATPMPKLEANLWLGKVNWVGNYRYFAGYIDEFRFSNNIARHSGPFAVPTEAYTEALPVETIDLLSAEPDGPLSLVLTFDLAPEGYTTETFTLTALDGGTLPTIASVAAGTAPEEILLTLATPGTAGKLYSVTVAGVTGPHEEALGTAIAPWTAPVPSPVQVAGASAESAVAVIIYVNQDLADTPPLRTAENYSIPGMTVQSATPEGPRAIRLVVTPGTPGTAYTATVASGQISSLDGGTIDTTNNTASFVAHAPVPVLWAPQNVRFSLDGRALTPLSLLPEEGEPPEALVIRAAWLSLLCHRRAGADDKLPDNRGDPPYRGGWWGNSHATVVGDQWGSKWWLLFRTRDSDVAAKAAEWGVEALAWAVADGLLNTLPTVTASQSDERLDVAIHLEIGSHVADLVFDLWGGA
jgi:phage gp46-like protein